ncbi:unnamed protein product, partial [Mesorhabditis spiculigera]
MNDHQSNIKMSLKYLLLLSIFSTAFGFNNFFRRFYEDKKWDSFLNIASEEPVDITFPPSETTPADVEAEAKKEEVTLAPIYKVTEAKLREVTTSTALVSTSVPKNKDCAGRLMSIPEFVEKLNCTAAEEWNRIMVSQNRPRMELRQQLIDWAVKYSVQSELVNFFDDLEQQYKKRSEKYAEVLNNVDTMLQRIDGLAQDETLSRSEERLAVAQLYDEADKIVIEVVNLMVQLVRSWAGEKLPFRKMRPLQGVRQIWTEI